MEIKIDYYVRNKETGKLSDVKHLSITESDILELAKQKANEQWNILEHLDYEPQIDKVII